MNLKNILIKLLLAYFFITPESSAVFSFHKLKINTAHLDSLYEELILNGERVGIIHIYSEFPDYKWTPAKNEGIACVDDAARAAIFYSHYYIKSGKPKARRRTEMLLKFILNMQAENGYFYNFIKEDNSINKTGKTSSATANWWSWRALWALSETYNQISKTNKDLAARILKSEELLIKQIKNDFVRNVKIIRSNGKKEYVWLPFKFASDQGAILALGLSRFYSFRKDSIVRKIIISICNGIIKMQKGSAEDFPYHAFLSWKNKWHAWGNMQAFALLTAGEVSGRDDFRQAAINEITNFYIYLKNKNYLSEFSLEEDGNYKIKQFPQIAYGIRPMIFASLKAFEITRDNKFAMIAGRLAAWFFGKNAARSVMYNEKTGICFDGILSANQINRNSGAESTIETLLSLLKINNNKIALNALFEQTQSSININNGRL